MSAVRIDARRGRLVQRVEVDARRAAVQQLDGLRGGLRDAQRRDRRVVVAATLQLREQRRAGCWRRTAPVMRSISATVRIGMSPGTIGTSMPAAAGALDEVEVDAVVEEQLGDDEVERRRRPWP